ncbi:MAG: hypothetical protein ACK4GN_01170 [Runella sp.]
MPKKYDSIFTAILCGFLIGEGARSAFGYIEFTLMHIQDKLNQELLFDVVGGFLLGMGLYQMSKKLIPEPLQLAFLVSACLSYTLTSVVVILQNPTIPNEYRQLWASILVSTFGILFGYFSTVVYRNK